LEIWMRRRRSKFGNLDEEEEIKTRKLCLEEEEIKIAKLKTFLVRQFSLYAVLLPVAFQ